MKCKKASSIQVQKVAKYKSLANPIAEVMCGMKTEWKWMELSDATFVFIFLCRSRNKYKNTRNKYENRYFRKQTWNEYGANTDEKQMIIGTNKPPESCSRTQTSQLNQKTCFPNLSRLFSVMREYGWVALIVQ
jgi:hypothetical protein